MGLSGESGHGVPERCADAIRRPAGSRGAAGGLSKRRDPCKTQGRRIPPRLHSLMQNFAPGDLKEVLALLQTGLELPADQREAWVAALDASKTRLKPTLSALLQKHAQHETDDFVKDLVRFTSGTDPDGAATLAPPPVVGGK